MYLARHRKQSDGEMREFDNYKKGIPPQEYVKSRWRHHFASWATLEPMMDATQEDFQTFIENMTEEQFHELEEDIHGELFNTMGLLMELCKIRGIKVDKS